MDVDKAEVGDSDIYHIKHFLTHAIGNIATCLFGWRASCRVQIIDQVAEDDTQKREGKACRDREEYTTNDEADIGFGVVEGEEEADVGERPAEAVFGENAFLQVPSLYLTSAYQSQLGSLVGRLTICVRLLVSEVPCSLLSAMAEDLLQKAHTTANYSGPIVWKTLVSGLVLRSLMVEERLTRAVYKRIFQATVFHLLLTLSRHLLMVCSETAVMNPQRLGSKKHSPGASGNRLTSSPRLGLPGNQRLLSSIKAPLADHSSVDAISGPGKPPWSRDLKRNHE